jgi:hypothetical protein
MIERSIRRRIAIRGKFETSVNRSAGWLAIRHTGLCKKV